MIYPLYARLSTAAVREDVVGGFEHDPTEATDTWNLEAWFRTDGS